MAQSGEIGRKNKEAISLIIERSASRSATKTPAALAEVLSGASNEVLQENHYYSFGMDMTGPWMDDAAQDNLYKYNGKEQNTDFGLHWSDYGARWYDATAGRWWSVDPLAGEYYSWATYNYVKNNPVRLIDPNGMAVDDYVFLNSSGLEMKRIEDKNVKQVTIVNDENLEDFNHAEQGQYTKPTDAYRDKLQSFGVTYDINSVEQLEELSVENGMEEDKVIMLDNGEMMKSNVEYSAPFSERENNGNVMLFIEPDNITKGVNRSAPDHKNGQTNDAHYHPGPYIKEAMNIRDGHRYSIGGNPSLPPSEQDKLNQLRTKDLTRNGNCKSCNRFDVVISPTHIHFYQENIKKSFSIHRSKL